MIIGHNINSNGDIQNAPREAKKSGAQIYQVFTVSPQQYTPKKIQDSILLNIRKYNTDNNIKCVIHGSFLLNFCREPESNIHQSGLNLLTTDLNYSVPLGAIGVVIHMGKNVDKYEPEKAFNNYVTGLKSALYKSNSSSVILLETGAGQGTEICTSIIELGKIRKAIPDNLKHRVGFCLDTCHMYAAGYNLGDPEYVDMLEKHISIYLGWDNVKLIHLNDSKDHLCSYKDRHEDICHGQIEFDGLLHFIKLANKYNVPIVLETPGEKVTYEEQMNYIRKMI